MDYWLNDLLPITRSLTFGQTQRSLILPMFLTLNLLIYYFIIILLIQKNYIHNLFTKFSTLKKNLPKTHLIIFIPYLYLYYKPTIKLSHITTSNSKKYENTDTNIWLQLGLISSSKIESLGVCVITVVCPGLFI